MVELNRDTLVFSFPEVHPDAKLEIHFMRTLRIPDDGKDYPLPPGFSRFPIFHVDDFKTKVPSDWLKHGGVLLPMYQAEAMWLRFNSTYPFAVKVAAGKINAVSGRLWRKGLTCGAQNYMVVPEQPWLDGFCIEKGIIRQFVAMPLGKGYTVESELTGKENTGGIQIHVYPLKKKIYEKEQMDRRDMFLYEEGTCYSLDASDCAMGLAAGGRMKQEIYRDSRGIGSWETEHTGRCFVHICNSRQWAKLTGEKPPRELVTASDYADYGLPWFEYYSEQDAITGSETLAGIKPLGNLLREERCLAAVEDRAINVDALHTIMISGQM